MSIIADVLSRRAEPEPDALKWPAPHLGESVRARIGETFARPVFSISDESPSDPDVMREHFQEVCGQLEAESASRKRAEARLDGEEPQINMGTAAGIVMREQADRATLAAGLRAAVRLVPVAYRRDVFNVGEYREIPDWAQRPDHNADIDVIRAALKLLPKVKLEDAPDLQRAEQAKTAERIIGMTFSSTDDVAACVGDAPKRLINCALAGLDLHAIDLSYCVFDACDLSRARLGVCHHAEFYSSNLRKAILTGADFRWVKTLNCRFDGADLLGIQVTVDCNLRTGMATDLNHDAHLMLYWLALGENPLLTLIIHEHIPERVRASLDATFRRNL